ncbi:MAG: hypothetical protein R6W83_02495 [Cryobacterium sp.]
MTSDPNEPNDRLDGDASVAAEPLSVEALTARLAEIDAAPLEERAAAFTALHAELTARLQG